MRAPLLKQRSTVTNIYKFTTGFFEVTLTNLRT